MLHVFMSVSLSGCLLVCLCVCVSVYVGVFAYVIIAILFVSICMQIIHVTAVSVCPFLFCLYLPVWLHLLI